MVKTIRPMGELSSYLVDMQTQTVKQIKTNRRTGAQFATDISKTKKAEQIRKEAGL